MLTLRSRLARCIDVLLSRVDDLEQQLAEGADVWTEYNDAVRTLAAIVEQSAPGAAGELLTTRQMAERLGLKPKTLLKRAKQGHVRPAMKAGKLIRWRGSEAIR